MTDKMIALDQTLRPKCEQILESKDSWYLSSSDSSLKHFIHQFLDSNSEEK
jgi:hypothetical protein